MNLLISCYTLLSIAPLVLAARVIACIRVPVRQHEVTDYRVSEVVKFILDNPDRKHFIALGMLRDKRDVLNMLVELGERPEEFDLNFASVQRFALGWSSVELRCCMSATRTIRNKAIAIQLLHRLRAPDAAYMVKTS